MCRELIFESEKLKLRAIKPVLKLTHTYLEKVWYPEALLTTYCHFSDYIPTGGNELSNLLGDRKKRETLVEELSGSRAIRLFMFPDQGVMDE